MKSFLKLITSVASLLVATTGVALAETMPFNVPEPGSIALVGVAIAAGVWASRRRK